MDVKICRMGGGLKGDKNGDGMRRRGISWPYPSRFFSSSSSISPCLALHFLLPPFPFNALCCCCAAYGQAARPSSAAAVSVVVHGACGGLDLFLHFLLSIALTFSLIFPFGLGGLPPFAQCGGLAALATAPTAAAASGQCQFEPAANTAAGRGGKEEGRRGGGGGCFPFFPLLLFSSSPIFPFLL